MGELKMPRFPVVILGLLILVPTTTLSEIVEVPLPGLHGAYPEEGSRTASFQLEQEPTVIHSAWIRIAGGATVGEMECQLEYRDSTWTYTQPVAFGFLASMTDTVSGGHWICHGQSSDVPGRFTSTYEFFGILHPTWEFLMDGEGEISLGGYAMGPALESCWMNTPDPTALVDEVVLILDLDFRVPLEQTTWGRIKKLFSE
jgi:hypothetical protein